MTVPALQPLHTGQFLPPALLFLRSNGRCR